MNATGYVYSASLPPLLSQAALQAIITLEENPQFLRQLEEKSTLVYESKNEKFSFFIFMFRIKLIFKITKKKGLSKLPGIKISGQKGIPVLHLRLEKNLSDRLDAEEILQDIVDEALEQGLLLTRAKYAQEERKMPPPSIRIYVSNLFSSEQLERSLSIIEE